ncbi:MAG: DUF4330 family protein [Candidatus Omnitrophota bacterium]|nr:DUF4330 family protein [Candidatus Omnitrophota bacterium]
MKYVDEKGRLFGIINVIDFIALFFFICLVPPLMYFGYKIIIIQQPESLGDRVKDVYLNCEMVKLKPDVATKMSVYDRELNAQGAVIGQIMELGEIEPYEKYASLKQRQALLKLRIEFRGSDLFYKGDLVDAYSELLFKTKKYTAVVIINEELTRMIRVKITLKDLNADVTALIKIGDKETDAEGKTIAEIVMVGTPTESFREFELNRGNFTIGKIVGKQQINIEMILKCQELSGEIYFKGKPLTYNLPIEFVTNKYKVKGFLSKPYENMKSNNPNDSSGNFQSEKDEERLK